jgi:ribosomal protein S4E
VKVSLPDKQILETVKLKEKNFAIITGGKNIGKYGKIVEIEKASGKKRRSALATIEDEKGNRYQTILDFIFATGEAQSLISLPEVA